MGGRAVIGIKHPKWAERPLLVVVPKKDQAVTREEMLEFLKGKIATWWMPDDVVFVDEIPHTATGKIQKIVLRDRFKDYGELSGRPLDEMIAGARVEVAVVLEGLGVEQDMALGRVGRALFHQDLDLSQHGVDVLGGARLEGRR